MSRKTNRQREKAVRKAGGIRKARGPLGPMQQLSLRGPDCRLDHDNMRTQALAYGEEPPVDCPECGECLVVR